MHWKIDIFEMRAKHCPALFLKMFSKKYAAEINFEIPESEYKSNPTTCTTFLLASQQVIPLPVPRFSLHRNNYAVIQHNKRQRFQARSYFWSQFNLTIKSILYFNKNLSGDFREKVGWVDLRIDIETGLISDYFFYISLLQFLIGYLVIPLSN